MTPLSIISAYKTVLIGSHLVTATLLTASLLIQQSEIFQSTARVQMPYGTRPSLRMDILITAARILVDNRKFDTLGNGK